MAMKYRAIQAFTAYPDGLKTEFAAGEEYELAPADAAPYVRKSLLSEVKRASKALTADSDET